MASPTKPDTNCETQCESVEQCLSIAAREQRMSCLESVEDKGSLGPAVGQPVEHLELAYQDAAYDAEVDQGKRNKQGDESTSKIIRITSFMPPFSQKGAKSSSRPTTAATGRALPSRIQNHNICCVAKAA